MCSSLLSVPTETPTFKRSVLGGRYSIASSGKAGVVGKDEDQTEPERSPTPSGPASSPSPRRRPRRKERQASRSPLRAPHCAWMGSCCRNVMPAHPTPPSPAACQPCGHPGLRACRSHPPVHCEHPNIHQCDRSCRPASPLGTSYESPGDAAAPGSPPTL